MKQLVTVQSAEAWKRAQERGCLRGDGRRVHRPFRPAYRWMMERMRMRGIGGHSFPVWAWDDVEHLDRVECSDTPHVIVVFRAEESRVLASDFYVWTTFVLNGSYIPESAEDNEEGDARGSWDRVFDPLVARAVLEGIAPISQFVVDRVPVASVLSVRTHRPRIRSAR